MKDYKIIIITNFDIIRRNIGLIRRNMDLIRRNLDVIIRNTNIIRCNMLAKTALVLFFSLFQVPCDVVVNLKPLSNKPVHKITDIFEVEPQRASIQAHSSVFATVAFQPTSMQVSWHSNDYKTSQPAKTLKSNSGGVSFC